MVAQGTQAAKGTQAEKVYEWERDCVEGLEFPFWDKDTVRAMVCDACRWLGIPEPTVAFSPLDVACLADVAANRIRIATWGREPVTVLHEVAHLADARRGPARDPHGPRFVRIAMDLYETFAGVPMDRLERTARLKGVAFDPPDPGRPTRQAARVDEDFFDGDF